MDINIDRIYCFHLKDGTLVLSKCVNTYTDQILIKDSLVLSKSYDDIQQVLLSKYDTFAPPGAVTYLMKEGVISYYELTGPIVDLYNSFVLIYAKTDVFRILKDVEDFKPKSIKKPRKKTTTKKRDDNNPFELIKKLRKDVLRNSSDNINEDDD